tara:strand:- start:343 stop:513 length:171 start_codon:yes stop_codon:yes gene_type:complete
MPQGDSPSRMWSPGRFKTFVKKAFEKIDKKLNPTVKMIVHLIRPCGEGTFEKGCRE